jgi:anthranilate synthase component I
MNRSLSLFPTALPLTEKGILERAPDWPRLFGRLQERGAAALLESSGRPGEDSTWNILAGEPEREFIENREGAWLADGTGTHPSPFGVHGFLDEVSLSRPGPGDGNFDPVPFCLSRAWFGVIGYECGPDVVRYPPIPQGPGKTFPLSYFFRPGRILAFNRSTGEYYLFGKPYGWPLHGEMEAPPPFKVSAIRPQSSLEDYTRMVEAAQEYIAQGDIYQANLSQSFRAGWEGDATGLYRHLRISNPSPFMGLFRGRGFTLVSSSPERLIQGQGDGLEMKPIAGTRPRGKDGVEDLQLQWQLRTDGKEQAEHLMLVDLARNDLGRVSRYGTVQVTRYAEVESYAKVHHLVSTVRGRRLPMTGLSDILKSVFPGGTITGCPKIRCMEIIRELEKGPRGFYTGSMGYAAPGGCFDLNILIRSFTLFDDGELDFRAGAGIVADSDPRKEYMETLYKVEALAQALGASLL